MKKKLAVVGAGIVTLGFILELADKIRRGKEVNISHISIFDKLQRELMGAGVPYSPDVSDPNHIFNVTSDLVTIPERGAFLEFMRSRKAEIEARFHRFFINRYQEKYKKRFGDTEEDEGPYLSDKVALREHYDRLWERFRTHYLNLDIATTYHPRILYGIYANELFEEALKTIQAHGITVDIHPQTEVTSLVSEDSGNVVIGFADTEEEFNHCILATGGVFVKSEFESDKYVDDIWPAEDLSRKLEELIEAEIAKRKAVGDQNNVIIVGLQGNSLSAMDVLKILFFYDGVFIDEEDGTMRFEYNTDMPYRIVVDMLSRSSVMQNVKGESKSVVAEVKFPPEEFPVTQKMMDKLAKRQGGQIALWQPMLMFAFEIEKAYRIEGNESAVDQVRDFIIFMIANIRKTDERFAEMTIEEINRVIRNSEDTDPTVQLLRVQQELHLDLHGANYHEMIEEFKRRYFVLPPIDQLRDSLLRAQRGEVVGGFFLPFEVAVQLSVAMPFYLLDEAEKAVRFSSEFVRLLESFVGAMPMISAKEILALNAAGLVNYKVIGYAAENPREENGKIVIRAENGEELIYDIVLNARGQSTDVRRDTSALYASLEQSGSVDYDTVGRIVKKGLHCERLPNVTIADSASGINSAFKRGTVIVQEFTKPEVKIAGARLSKDRKLSDLAPVSSEQLLLP